jgi:hypothetical protein
MAKPANLFVPASFTACTNSTSEVVMGTVTIPAFFLRSPYKLGISYAVQTPSTNSTDTFVPKVKVNAIVAASLAAHDVVNNEVIDGQAEGMFKDGKLHVRSLSASSATATLGGVHLVDQTVDTNADVVITLTGQWSVANAGNNAVAKEFIVSLQPLD